MRLIENSEASVHGVHVSHLLDKHPRDPYESHSFSYQVRCSCSSNEQICQIFKIELFATVKILVVVVIVVIVCYCRSLNLGRGGTLLVPPGFVAVVKFDTRVARRYDHIVHRSINDAVRADKGLMRCAVGIPTFADPNRFEETCVAEL